MVSCLWCKLGVWGELSILATVVYELVHLWLVPQSLFFSFLLLIRTFPAIFFRLVWRQWAGVCLVLPACVFCLPAIMHYSQSCKAVAPIGFSELQVHKVVTDTLHSHLGISTALLLAMFRGEGWCKKSCPLLTWDCIAFVVQFVYLLRSKSCLHVLTPWLHWFDNSSSFLLPSFLHFLLSFLFILPSALSLSLSPLLSLILYFPLLCPYLAW